VTIYGIATKFGTTMCSYDNTFAFYGKFYTLMKRKTKNKKGKKTEAIATNLVSINEPPKTIDTATKKLRKKYCKMKKKKGYKWA